MITLGGAPVLSGAIDLPLHGAGTIEATIAAAEAPSGAVVLDCDGGLQLHGSVVRATAFRDSVGVEVVLGAGGLGAHVAGSWRSALLRDPLSAIMDACGETLAASASAAVLGLSLARWHCAGSGRACLDALAVEASRQLGEVVHWRTLDDGAIWIGTETWASATLPDSAHLLDVDLASQAFVIGAETPALLPGVDLAGVGRLWHVVHEIEPNGVRSRVETTDPGAVADFARAVRAVLGLRGARGSAPADTRELWRFGLWDATVLSAAADGSTVDVRFDDERMQPAQGVRLAAPFPGGYTVASGNARAIVCWLGGSAREAWAIPIWTAGSASKIVIPATAMFLGAASGTQKVALADSLLQRIQDIEAKFDAHVHPFTGTIAVVGAGGTCAGTTTATATATAHAPAFAASIVEAK